MSEVKDWGGTAYPVNPPLDPGGGSAAGYPYPESGMFLRDYFAGQALARHAELISLDESDVWVKAQLKVIAKLCYDQADAMIAARNTGNK